MPKKKKPSERKYSEAAQKMVHKELRAYKEGKAHSGTSRKKVVKRTSHSNWTFSCTQKGAKSTKKTYKQILNQQCQPSYYALTSLQGQPS